MRDLVTTADDRSPPLVPGGAPAAALAVDADGARYVAVGGDAGVAVVKCLPANQGDEVSRAVGGGTRLQERRRAAGPWHRPPAPSHPFQSPKPVWTVVIPPNQGAVVALDAVVELDALLVSTVVGHMTLLAAANGAADEVRVRVDYGWVRSAL